MDLLDLMTATQDAVFRALVDRTEHGVIQPMTDLLQDAVPSPPIALIESIDMEFVGDKSDQVEAMTVDIVVLYRGDDRRELLTAMHAARTALDRRALAIAGVDFQPPRCTAASASGRASDGKTYVGLLTFTIDAEPA